MHKQIKELNLLINQVLAFFQVLLVIFNINDDLYFLSYFDLKILKVFSRDKLNYFIQEIL